MERCYVVKTVKLFQLQYPVEYILTILPDYPHFLQKILFDLLLRAILIGIYICILLYILWILIELVSISFNIMPQRLLGVPPTSLEAKLDPAKKLAIGSELFANLLVELLFF